MLCGQQFSPERGYCFGRRRGRRMRNGRAALLKTLLPKLEIDLPVSQTQDWSVDRSESVDRTESLIAPLELFGPEVREVWLEIGFGSGEHLAAQAERHPGVGLIGCEPFLNGVARLLGIIAERNLSNIRILVADARLFLPNLAEDSIARCFALFSDPWPKYRHRARRFISTDSLNQLARVLKDEALLRLASDQSVLVRWMMEHLWYHPDFSWSARCPQDWREPPSDWIPTRYQQKALAESRCPVYLDFARRPRVGRQTWKVDL